MVVLGLNEPASLKILATTFKDGDPSFAGVLAGVALGIPTYHILELKAYVPEAVWDEQMGMQELQLEDAEIAAIVDAVQSVRTA